MFDISKAKDNNYFKGEYVDSEILKDNFMGTEDELKVIAMTVYELCYSGSDLDELEEEFGCLNIDYMDRVQSMIQCDYDYLSSDQQNEVERMVYKLEENDGEFSE